MYAAFFTLCASAWPVPSFSHPCSAGRADWHRRASALRQIDVATAASAAGEDNPKLRTKMRVQPTSTSVIAVASWPADWPVLRRCAPTLADLPIRTRLHLSNPSRFQPRAARPLAVAAAAASPLSDRNGTCDTDSLPCAHETSSPSTSPVLPAHPKWSGQLATISRRAKLPHSPKLPHGCAHCMLSQTFALLT